MAPQKLHYLINAKRFWLFVFDRDDQASHGLEAFLLSTDTYEEAVAQYMARLDRWPLAQILDSKTGGAWGFAAKGSY